MKKIPLILLLNFFSLTLFSQINFTANDTVPAYDKQFLVGINPGYHGNDWSDQATADISYGNPDLGVEGIGMKTFRVPLPEAFLDFYGYEVLVPPFQHYEDLGMRDLTVFLQNPLEAHKDTVKYCNDEQAQMFANLYTPIWDDGANGTPVNDTNFAALYIYRTVSIYKDNVKFWEIWNEPDFSFSGDNGGWKPPGMPGNWWDDTPGPCLTQLKAPVYHYIRLLKIAYEVIKTLDDDAFVSVGGIGFESYLDVLLRNTDNPVDGSVTAEYPLTGGAYFDALSFHSYPHFNGTLLYLDTASMQYLPKRHSDAAADGIINHQSRFQAVLDNYGYDGSTFPKKEIIITETGIPNKPLNNWIGSPEAQRNYVMKVQVAAYQNDIRQIDFYVLANSVPYDQADNWLQVMGMYEQISDKIPYEINLNQSGIGLRTMGKLLDGAFYDMDQTDLLNLPDEINGAAFLMPDGMYRYVLWAATQTDSSEIASATYTFPTNISEGGMYVKEWDYGVTNAVDSIFASTITLTGDPTFIEQFNFVGTQNISSVKDLSVLPNPFKEDFVIEFSLAKNAEVKIELSDAKGKIVKVLEKNLTSGNQQIKMDAGDLPDGIYLGKMTLAGEEMQVFKMVKVD